MEKKEERIEVELHVEERDEAMGYLRAYRMGPLGNQKHVIQTVEDQYRGKEWGEESEKQSFVPSWDGL